MLKVEGPDNLFNYYLNDPTTPTLVIRVPLPKLTDIPLKIEVIGFREGPLVQEDSIRIQAASTLFSIAFTMKWVNSIRKMEKWAVTDILRVNPRAGKQFNAYYDRYGLHFFYEQHHHTKKIVFTCDSTEAVNHEFGHAILDSFRPDLWDLNEFEIFSFHEAFGDIISMLSSLNHQMVIEYALKETDGDLSKSNVISRVAEEFGAALCVRDLHLNRPNNCLRDASQLFQYVTPESLPPGGSLSVLGKEAHNFSRVFSSAWYKIFVELYNKYNKGNPIESIIYARDVMARLTILCLPNVEKKSKIFCSVAEAIIKTDKEIHGGTHIDIIRKIFLIRNILPPQTLY